MPIVFYRSCGEEKGNRGWKRLRGARWERVTVGRLSVGIIMVCGWLGEGVWTGLIGDLLPGPIKAGSWWALTSVACCKRMVFWKRVGFCGDNCRDECWVEGSPVILGEDSGA